MQVKLVSKTMPVVEGVHNPEDLIVYCARVSNPGNQSNMETAPKLLNYLIRNKHWSPFEMVSMCVEIQTSRAIAQQILRHRSFSFQEFSQRYAKVQNIEDFELRLQGKTNRQVGDEAYHNPEIEQRIFDLNKQADELYRDMVDLGVAKESARFVLPLATQTTLYMTGTLRSWIHYFEVRCDQHTQKEHREIALAVRDIFDEHFPNIAEALKLT